MTLMLERKENQFTGKIGGALPLDTKMLTEDGEFEGYASVFGERDQGDDIVMPGAFAESIARRGAKGIKLLWQHNTEKLSGKWTEIREDTKGLFVKGKLFLNIDRVREIHELMKQEAVDGLSIGFRTLIDEYDRTMEVRRLVKVDLREISLVTFPMLESATVTLVKSDTLPTEREFECWLRDAGFSTWRAKAIVSSGFKSLCNAERDASAEDEHHQAARDAGVEGQDVKEALQQLTRMLRS